VRVAVLCTPYVPVMVTVREKTTTVLLVTVNVAVEFPAATVTLVGTVA
jgi:hypothetical protein